MIKYYPELIQGSDEWFAARCGLLTASEMKRIINPPPKTETRIKKNGEPYKQREWNILAEDDECCAHLYELLAQRINKYVEPHYIGDDMLRGQEDEIRARMAYNENYGLVQDCGFITNDKWGFKLGYSPDGIVGEDGLIECKSRRQKFQVETIIEGDVPDDFKIQLQTGLLVSERKWCDFLTYCGGMPMYTLRVYPDEKLQAAIIDASGAFHDKMKKLLDLYNDRLADKESRLVPTERIIEQEINL